MSFASPDLNSSKNSIHLGGKLQTLVLDKFKEGGFNANYNYPTAKILNYLDQVGGTTFDRETANIIFDQCAQTTLGDVNIKDFADKYCEGVLISRNKIGKMKETIEQKKKKLHEFRMRTDEIHEKDKTRPRDREILVIRVNEVAGFDLNATNVYLTFTMDSITKKTKSYPYSQKIEINEFIDYEVRREAKFFTVFLYRDNMEGGNWTGTADINVADLVRGIDAGKNVSIELSDLRGKYLSGRLKLDLKLLNSYEEELKTKIKLIEADIADNQDNLEFTQKYLQTCIVPFPQLDDDKLIKKILGNILEVKRGEINEELTANPRKSYKRRSVGQLYSDLFKQNPILKVAVVILTLYTICTLVASFTRSLFYDQFVCMMVTGQVFIFVHFNALLAYKMIVLLVVQVVIDCYWLWYYGYLYWGKYIDPGRLKYLRHVVVIDTICLVILRVVMCWLMLKLGKLRISDDEEDYNKYAPDIQDLKIDPEFSRSEIRLSML